MHLAEVLRIWPVQMGSLVAYPPILSWLIACLTPIRYLKLSEIDRLFFQLMEEYILTVMCG